MSIVAKSRLFLIPPFLWLLLGAASLAAADRPRILGVSHIAVKVSDIDKSSAFYRDFLGFTEWYRLNGKDGSLQIVVFKVSDDQWIEVFLGRKPDENRLHQVAFRVDDAEAMRAHLAAHGVKVPRSVPKGRTQNLNFTVKDPNGYTIEFVQYLPGGWTARDQGKFLSETRVSQRITHAGVSVEDVAAATKFYGDVLGCKETWRGSSRGDELSWIHLTVPDGTDYVEFMLAKRPSSLGSLPAHFCLLVPDMEKAKAALDRSSYRQNYGKPLEVTVGKNRKRQLNLFDPDGVRVELMEPDTVDGKPVPPSQAPLPKR